MREGTVDPASWRVWLEPALMRAPISAPIDQSERTELAAGMLRDAELHTVAKPDWETLGVEWDDFNQRAKANAAADLATLETGVHPQPP